MKLKKFFLRYCYESGKAERKKLKDNGPATWNSFKGFFRKKEYCPLTSQTVEDRNFL